MLAVRLHRFQLRESSAFEVETYASTADLVRSLNEPNLIFLSLADSATGPGGSQLHLAPARALRRRYPNAAIILLSDVLEDAVNGYGVPVQGCLPSDADAAHFARTMKACLGQLRRQDADAIWLITGASAQPVRIDELVYVAVERNLLTLHTVDGEIQAWRTLSSLEEELAGKGFCRTSKSHLVNLRGVTKVHDDRVEMLGNRTVPVSRRKRAEVTRAVRGLAAATR